MIQPNLQEAQKFLDSILGLNAKACFQIIPNSKECTLRGTWKFGTLKEHQDWLVSANQSGAGVYVVINETDGRGREAKNITRVRSHFVDLDGAPLDPVERLKPQPHVVIETSPGRYQAFWRIGGAPVEEFKPVQQALASKFKGDPSVCDPSRVMRLPGFFHMKGEPFMSHILKQRSHPPVPFQGFKNAMGLRIARESVAPALQRDGEKLQDFPQGQRTRSLVTLAGSLWRTAVDEADLWEQLCKHNKLRCKPPLPETELKKSVFEWIVKKDKGHIYPARDLADDGFRIRDENRRNASKECGQIYSWRQLKSIQFPPVRWIVNGLLPEGLCILAGRPKAGKSWLIQTLCLAAATGEPALGYFPVEDPGSVLSISLEDNERRFKGRMLKILGCRNDQDNTGIIPPHNAYFVRDWPTLPKAIGEIERWITTVEKPRLVVIDTLAKIRQRSGTGREGNVYDRDYADVGSLQKLAGQYQVAIILVHHQRKAEVDDDFDSISGSAGLAGASDTMWLLNRKSRTSPSGTLIITGRDVYDRRYDIVFETETGRWLYKDGMEQPPVEVDGARADVLQVMSVGTPISYKEVAQIMGKKPNTILEHMKKLVGDGLIEAAVRGKGYYTKIDRRPATPPIEEQPYPDTWDDAYGDDYETDEVNEPIQENFLGGYGDEGK